MQLFVSVISGIVVTIDGQLNSIDVCLEPFGTFYFPKNFFYFLIQLFVNVISGTATSIDGR